MTARSTPIGPGWQHAAVFVVMPPYGIALRVAAATYADRRNAVCDTLSACPGPAAG